MACCLTQQMSNTSSQTWAALVQADAAEHGAEDAAWRAFLAKEDAALAAEEEERRARRAARRAAKGGA